MINKLITIAFLMVGFSSLAQVPVKKDQDLLEERKEILHRIQAESGRFVLSSKEKKRLSEQHHFPLTLSLDHQRTAFFQYMDGVGKPVYYTTYNVNAAHTTGASSMQPGGELDLNLTGKGMVVGIYDQTRPKSTHREFGSRVTQIDGSTEVLSVHATHVTGTLLATGINDNARGMANEATGWAFNWDGDISKMIQNGYDPDLKPGGHLISNHSYGNLIGWYQHSNGNWAWAGNESISNKEDYRFGFYTSKSRQIDDLAFSKPFYTIVWAAGNDRSDLGDGTRNPDGPEDSIGPEGVSKNNITIGAVSEVRDYKGPEEVVMSSFSSWGPVDDGRVKPDLVAMGVNVFSTAITTEDQLDSYTTMSGTSMAAPNATGSLFLLQELYHTRNSGRYMRSATLKALAIHTAREAGTNPGPDYRFGWGLLNVKAAAEMILNEDGSSNIIREQVLKNNEVVEWDFISDGLTPIKATIAWTDPAGNPPAPSIDPEDLMLVNDLDLRIIDEDGKVFYPWTLNPQEGATARAVNDKDNFRDNVEQVLIPEPESKKYTLKISHKGGLKNNLQAFSLILNAGLSDGQDKTLYWIGGEGDWQSPNNWSLASNGPSAGLIPDSGTRVVIDETTSSSSKISFTANATVFSLNVFGNSTVEMDLDSNELSITNGFRVSNQLTTLQNGYLKFESETNTGNIIDIGPVVLEQVEMSVTAGEWNMISAGILDRLVVSGARLELDLSSLQLRQLMLKEGSTVLGKIQQVVFKEEVEIHAQASLDVSPIFKFIGKEGFFRDMGRKEGLSLVNEGQKLQLRQSGRLSYLGLITGELLFMQTNTEVDDLDLRQGVTLNLMESNQIHILENLAHQESSGDATLIKANNKGIFRHDPYRKYCFENIKVENVDFFGEAVVNLGSGALIINSANWESLSCSEVLFVDFETAFNCEGALVEFINTTEGPVDRFEWEFGSLGTSREKNPSFIFPQQGVYQVILKAVGQGEKRTHKKEITVGENVLKKPSIVTNGSLLTSLVPAPGYQWYKDGNKIEGAVERSFAAEDKGVYQVAVVNESCNRISDAVVISGIPDKLPPSAYGYSIGPNPTSSLLQITINNDYTGQVEFEFYAANGTLLKSFITQKNQNKLERDLRLDFPSGIYVLWIKTGDIALPHRIIKR